MSRFSYGLDVSEEIAREKEVRRKIASAKEEDESVKLDPKYQQEIDALSEDGTSVQTRAEAAEEDDVVIRPARVRSARRNGNGRKSESKAEAKSDSKSDSKADKKAAKSKPAQSESPASPTPAHSHTEPQQPGDGTARLVLVLLLISALALSLIYVGLSSQKTPVSGQAHCYYEFAQNNRYSLATLDNLSDARRHWFLRALEADNEAEAAALMKMALCNDKAFDDVTLESNPLTYLRCDVGGKAFAVRESDLRALVNLSAPITCESLDGIISCDGGWTVDGIVATRDNVKPKFFIARSGGYFTVVKDVQGSDAAFSVMSSKDDDFVGYTLEPGRHMTMGFKFFVGDQFNQFTRVYLDHHVSAERVVVYEVV